MCYCNLSFSTILVFEIASTENCFLLQEKLSTVSVILWHSVYHTYISHITHDKIIKEFPYIGRFPQDRIFRMFHVQQGINGSARKRGLLQDTGYMVEKTYHIAPFLDAFGAYLMPQLPINGSKVASIYKNNRSNVGVNLHYLLSGQKPLLLVKNYPNRLYAWENLPFSSIFRPFWGLFYDQLCI